MTNYSIKRIVISLLFLQIGLIAFSQSPKREMRSAWLATVWQLDWPKSQISTTGNELQINAQKKLMTRILDSLVSANMNAVCFQVRSRCDAMYKSSYEPWSSDLVATRGMDPGYDPLAFVIEEGHKRGLEVHAWVNPYRFESVAGQWSGLPGDYNTDHPDWVLTHGGASILNPGVPEVRQRITDIIKEIVTNYDVDGVLFDDYFYLSGTSTEDAGTYSKYNPDGLELSDWRRDNVDKMIAKVYNMIQGVKPQIKFGVSPAGIWDVSSSVAASYGLTLPSGISGGYAYNSIYCNPIAWLQQGTVDYISPQIYWTTGSGSTDYNKLAPWWSDVALHFGKQFYSSHSISALTASVSTTSVQINGVTLPTLGLSSTEQAILQENTAPKTRFVSSEVGSQIDANRNSDKNDAPGSIFYSATKLYATTGFIDYLKRNKFTDKALTPAIHWKSTSTPSAVSNILLNGNVLSWTPADGNMRYSIYAIPNSEVNNPSVFNSSEYLLGVSYSATYTLNASADFSNKTFAVAVLDRYGNEYAPVIMGQSSGTASTTTATYPADQSNVLAPFTFTWEAVPEAISYILEIATDANFTNLLCAREVYTNSFSTTNLKQLSEGQTYYWRVKTKAVGSEVTSSVRTFVPTIFAISKPVDASQNVSLTPGISWTDAGEGATYQLEIASAVSFISSSILYSANSNSNSYQLPAGILVGLNTYYLRVKTQINGVEIYSPIISFTTEAVVPDIPQIVSPITNSTVESSQLKVTWNEEPRAKNFRIELCSSESFYPRQTKAKLVNPFIYETIYDGLTSGTYYLRARAEYSQKNESGAILTNYTDWSDTIKIDYRLSTGMENTIKEGNSFYILSSESGNKQLILNIADYSKILVSINSISGVLLAHLWNNGMPAGQHILDIPVEHLPSGVYLLIVEMDGKREVLKILK
ncbi:family 10 glycosylhydrolase [uncultured Bacteroides sp.]|uniref:family 10 glycosylhydrolase n=1 Tax=uncultured Bacteroides sp. TaxID=162156 RepID=UPI002AAA9177|nr:family 10 glycosylhydrolase [uncultured Bacteroides sp.]